VDLLPPLRKAAAEGQQLYFSRDTHWTPLGHCLAAESIRAYLAGRQTPP
jgi:phospholipase/lecithinase/hemolysin